MFKGGKAESYRIKSGKLKGELRKVDNFVDGTAKEIKSGFLKNNDFIRRQIAKDLELRKLENIDIEWHLFEGGDSDLIKYMELKGIKVVDYTKQQIVK